MAERQGTQIDYFLQCRGIWLEKGNLDGIIEKSVAGTPVTAAPQNDAARYDRHCDHHHDKHHDDHHDGPYRKRRGFLHDLFD
jgi:Zn-finger nucleic acid-binding protein